MRYLLAKDSVGQNFQGSPGTNKVPRLLGLRPRLQLRPRRSDSAHQQPLIKHVDEENGEYSRASARLTSLLG